jgi:hypothetical protein
LCSCSPAAVTLLISPFLCHCPRKQEEKERKLGKYIKTDGKAIMQWWEVHKLAELLPLFAL